MAKKTKFHCGKGGTVIAAISPEIVFRLALSLARCRDGVSMANVFNHRIGPVSMSLFHADGTMRRTDEAELVHQHEAQAEGIPKLRACNKGTLVSTRDPMAVIQMMAGEKFCTGCELAAQYLKQVLKGFDKTKSAMGIFDNSNSVKTAER
ncbi:hypothetical protein UY3_12572 [Chelonia mydas]|uniref:Uncharacterized protein n=1 Tax=Chelonia mydas TaxID=8469 RepID=M7AXR9_CHEMY|nr:hypothetical protein UY3_12572 [Chelonia mydas]